MAEATLKRLFSSTSFSLPNGGSPAILTVTKKTLVRRVMGYVGATPGTVHLTVAGVRVAVAINNAGGVFGVDGPFILEAGDVLGFTGITSAQTAEVQVVGAEIE